MSQLEDAETIRRADSDLLDIIEITDRLTEKTNTESRRELTDELPKAVDPWVDTAKDTKSRNLVQLMKFAEVRQPYERISAIFLGSKHAASATWPKILPLAGVLL